MIWLGLSLRTSPLPSHPPPPPPSLSLFLFNAVWLTCCLIELSLSILVLLKLLTEGQLRIPRSLGLFVCWSVEEWDVICSALIIQLTSHLPWRAPAPSAMNHSVKLCIVFVASVLFLFVCLWSLKEHGLKERICFLLFFFFFTKSLTEILC